jgi:alginate O-acetyltransferase complex protein AlgI
MTFTSTTFVIFMLATFCAYYGAAPSGGLQLAILVIASAVFYAWDNPYLLLLLVAVTAVASMASIVLAYSKDRGIRTASMWLSVSALLVLLGFFKYGDLFYRSFVGISRMPDWEAFFINVPLPIGISFYIFHAISLIVDVARGDYRIPPERRTAEHASRTFLYITFFPQLIAGPIVKAKDFMPQIRRKEFGAIQWTASLRLLVLGYFLKLVIADNLAAQTALMTYPYFQDYSSARLVALLIGYSCQIFSDFFGYSLIAMGLAELFGYRLPVNFNRPYIASSFSDFWRRWHMSLSAWLRDYLYIPLGGSRHGSLRTYLNLFIVMFLGGLWHGASWNFAIWGTIHGAALAVERPFLATRFFTTSNTLVALVRTCFVFTVVSIAWLFFKFHDASQSFAYLSSIAHNTYPNPYPRDLYKIYVYCFPILLYHVMPAIRFYWAPVFTSRWTYAAMLVLIVTNAGIPGAFIYFRF